MSCLACPACSPLSALARCDGFHRVRVHAWVCVRVHTSCVVVRHGCVSCAASQGCRAVSASASSSSGVGVGSTASSTDSSAVVAQHAARGVSLLSEASETVWRLSDARDVFGAAVALAAASCVGGGLRSLAVAGTAVGTAVASSGGGGGGRHGNELLRVVRLHAGALSHFPRHLQRGCSATIANPAAGAEVSRATVTYTLTHTLTHSLTHTHTHMERHIAARAIVFNPRRRKCALPPHCTV